MAKDNVKRERQRERRKRIALDFDGVLHKYSKKWHDGTIYDEALGIKEVNRLALEYDLVIFTCREPLEDVHAWVLEKYGLDIPVTNAKPHADMYIDDRGYQFRGNWNDVLQEVTWRKEVDHWSPWNLQEQVNDKWDYEEAK